MIIHIAPRGPAAHTPDDDLGFGLPDTGQSRWGWSYYGTWRRCKRLWAFKYGAGAQGQPHPAPHAKTNPRGLGTVVHAGIAAHYLRRMGRPGMSPEEAAMEAASRLRLTPALQHRAIKATQSYVRTFGAERFGPVSVETEYEIAFGPEYGGGGDLGDVPYTARLDIVLESPGGKVFIVDTKTAVRPSSAALDAYALHGQMHGFQWIGRATWGAKFGGVLISTVGSDEPFRCTREPVPAAPHLVAAFPRSIRNTAAEIAWWTEINGPDPKDYDPLAQETGCKTTYGFCDYRQPCSGGTFR